METTIGGKRYPAFGIGKLAQSDSKKSLLRWSSQFSAPDLTTIATNIADILQLPISVNAKYINIQEIKLIIDFFDSSASTTYNVSTVSKIRIVNVQNTDRGVNLFLPNHLENKNLNISVSVINQAAELRAIITGADVQRFTGIAPAAGDTVTIDLSLSYFAGD